ncbi:hypothetical protein DFH11DRAFT_1541514 [Phellopilus nigrolimitatus]|nr:hypothetical protein DFH11DRAFT_1541514 [Phellopilus nigrolimitatus]
MFEDVCIACSRPVDTGSVPLNSFLRYRPVLTPALAPPQSRVLLRRVRRPGRHVRRLLRSLVRQPVPVSRCSQHKVRQGPHDPHPRRPAAPLRPPQPPSRLPPPSRPRFAPSGPEALEQAASYAQAIFAIKLVHGQLGAVHAERAASYDDDDSMSDPEFTLDPRADPTLHPSMLSYARRPSATNTRSTVVPFVSSSSSTSTSASATGVSKVHAAGSEKDLQQHEDTHSKARRPRHMHHLSVPTVALLDNFDRDRLFYADAVGLPRNAEQVRPHSVKYDRHLDYDGESMRSGDVESDYAVLAKSSVATKGAETIREPKSRRAPTRSAPERQSPGVSQPHEARVSVFGRVRGLAAAGLAPRNRVDQSAFFPQCTQDFADGRTLAHLFFDRYALGLVRPYQRAHDYDISGDCPVAPRGTEPPRLGIVVIPRQPRRLAGEREQRRHQVHQSSLEDRSDRCHEPEGRRRLAARQVFHHAPARTGHAVRARRAGGRARARTARAPAAAAARGSAHGARTSAARRRTARAGCTWQGLGMTAVQRGRPHVRGMGARGRRARRTGTDDAEESAAGERPRGAVEIDWLDVRETEDAEVGPEPARERRRVPLRA